MFIKAHYLIMLNISTLKSFYSWIVKLKIELLELSHLSDVKAEDRSNSGLFIDCVFCSFLSTLFIKTLVCSSSLRSLTVFCQTCWDEHISNLS